MIAELIASKNLIIGYFIGAGEMWVICYRYMQLFKIDRVNKL